MKLTFLLSALLIFFAFDAVSCPVWMTGKLYVINENNERINATVWKVSHADSFSLEKGERFHWYDTIESNRDTNVFEFWEGGWGGWDDEEKPKISKSYYRIQAEGYADLIINDIDFKGRDETGIPVLLVKMYPRRYHKMGEVTSLIEQYVYNQTIEVSDTIELNYVSYVENLENKDHPSGSIQKTLLAVESYPNPITDYIIMKINSVIVQPYVLKLMDNNGQILKETYLNLQETKFELQSQAKGNYYVQVFDPKGNPVYSRKFVKL
jgi:hypothetical protein